MDDNMVSILKHLRLRNLLDHWDEYLATARKQRMSVERLLRLVLEQEYQAKCDNARLLRRQRAHLPEVLELETFPFQRQPKLDRQRIVSLYDSFEYMEKNQNIIWVGPTGCGKSGLATAFLLQALDRGCRGYFVPFAELVAELYAAMADRSEAKVLRRYLTYAMALCDRLTETGHVFNMKDCESLRDPLDKRKGAAAAGKK